MPNFSDYELDLIMDELNEHASTLQALSKRLEATDLDAAHTTQGIAHDLWEIRKGLGDGRRPEEPSGDASVAVWRAAIELFEGNRAAAEQWLYREAYALDWKRPIDVMRENPEQVLVLIGRIEYGICV